MGSTVKSAVHVYHWQFWPRLLIALPAGISGAMEGAGSWWELLLWAAVTLAFTYLAWPPVRV